MSELLKWAEEEPAAFSHGYASGTPEAILAIEPFPIWSRIESWTGRRWAQRGFVAVVEGPGEWIAPVEPVTVETVEVWDGGEWALSDLNPSPLGICLGNGTYRITGTAGSGQAAPDDVREAFNRLAAYGLAMVDQAGASSYSVSIGEISESWRRDRAGLAAAIHQSGAGDLLRPYRRAK